MDPIEFKINHFEVQFKEYMQNKDLLLRGLNSRGRNINLIISNFSKFQELDVKLRLAFAISDIILDANFTQKKEDDLKRCHLLYYKLIDLWFAYDSYLKFYKSVFQSGKDFINWLDTTTHINYSNAIPIAASLKKFNDDIKNNLNNKLLRKPILKYINYCINQDHISPTQKVRLQGIRAKFYSKKFKLKHSELLGFIYAVRNNFVHNGETTVVPVAISFRDKYKLLEIFYPYLCIVVLTSINITCKKASLK